MGKNKNQRKNIESNISYFFSARLFTCRLLYTRRSILLWN
nr:MAG TPA: hypothetical protein [Caudoviricetes sp.]